AAAGHSVEFRGYVGVAAGIGFDRADQNVVERLPGEEGARELGAAQAGEHRYHRGGLAREYLIRARAVVVVTGVIVGGEGSPRLDTDMMRCRVGAALIESNVEGHVVAAKHQRPQTRLGGCSYERDMVQIRAVPVRILGVPEVVVRGEHALE